MVKLKYQRAKQFEVFLLKSLDRQSAPRMSYSSFKVQRFPTVKGLNLKKGTSGNIFISKNVFSRGLKIFKSEWISISILTRNMSSNFFPCVLVSM